MIGEGTGCARLSKCAAKLRTPLICAPSWRPSRFPRACVSNCCCQLAGVAPCKRSILQTRPARVGQTLPSSGDSTARRRHSVVPCSVHPPLSTRGHRSTFTRNGCKLRMKRRHPRSCDASKHPLGGSVAPYWHQPLPSALSRLARLSPDHFKLSSFRVSVLIDFDRLTTGKLVDINRPTTADGQTAPLACLLALHAPRLLKTELLRRYADSLSCLQRSRLESANRRSASSNT